MSVSSIGGHLSAIRSFKTSKLKRVEELKDAAAAKSMMQGWGSVEQLIQKKRAAVIGDDEEDENDWDE